MRRRPFELKQEGKVCRDPGIIRVSRMYGNALCVPSAELQTAPLSLSTWRPPCRRRDVPPPPYGVHRVTSSPQKVSRLVPNLFSNSMDVMSQETWIPLWTWNATEFRAFYGPDIKRWTAACFMEPSLNRASVHKVRPFIINLHGQISGTDSPRWLSWAWKYIYCRGEGLLQCWNQKYQLHMEILQ